MKFWFKAAAAAAVAAAGIYAVKRFFSRRAEGKEVQWSTILPEPFSDMALQQKPPSRMMHPLVWVGKE